MSDISLADILRLPVGERIQLVEDIWESIADSPESVELTEPQRAELARRLQEFHKNLRLGSPWKDVRKRILHAK